MAWRSSWRRRAAPSFLPPPPSSLCRTELVPPSPSSRALLHTPHAGAAASPAGAWARLAAASASLPFAAPAARLRADPGGGGGPLDPHAAADLRPPPPTRARRSPKILTPPRTRARRRALQQTRPAAATPSSPRCCCPKPPRSRAPPAAMAWSSSRRLGLAPGRATPSCSRRRGSALSCAAVDAHPPPRPRAPRAATDPHRRPLLLRRRHEPCTCGCEPLHHRMWPRPLELVRRGRPPAAAVTRRRWGQAEAEEIGREAGALAWSRRVLRPVLPPAAERARDGAHRGRRCRSQAPPPAREQ